MNGCFTIAVLSVLIAFQASACLFAKKKWGLLININSINNKLLILILSFGVVSGYTYYIDMIIILVVMNLVGTIILSRFIGLN